MIKLPKTIKFIFTDFDGICTDNCVYIDSKGEMSRKLNFKDIMGFSLLKKNGYKVAIISGEKNSAIEKIRTTFNIEDVYQDIRIKIDVLKSIIDKYNLSQEEYVYIGDDVNDYESLCFAKYRITVPDAIKKIKELEGIQVTETRGGDGAFREVVDALLNA